MLSQSLMFQYVSTYTLLHRSKLLLHECSIINSRTKACQFLSTCAKSWIYIKFCHIWDSKFIMCFPSFDFLISLAIVSVIVGIFDTVWQMIDKVKVCKIWEVATMWATCFYFTKCRKVSSLTMLVQVFFGQSNALLFFVFCDPMKGSFKAYRVQSSAGDPQAASGGSASPVRRAGHADLWCLLARFSWTGYLTAKIICSPPIRQNLRILKKSFFPLRFDGKTYRPKKEEEKNVSIESHLW